MSVSFDVATIPMVAGAILSLFFSYVPGVEAWYNGLDPALKRVVMLVLILCTAGGIYALGCAGMVTTTVACDKAGLVQAVNIFFSVLIANQGTFLLTKKS